jgi:hypothetical protein
MSRKQCNSKSGVLFNHGTGEGRCRGIHGHAGMHWVYDYAGWFIQWATRRGLKRFDSAGCWNPPGHKSYVSPEDKIHEDFQWGGGQ